MFLGDSGAAIELINTSKSQKYKHIRKVSPAECILDTIEMIDFLKIRMTVGVNNVQKQHFLI